MVRCSYNTAETTGLSIRCTFGPAAWFSHGKDVGVSCYATDTATSVWIYIPLHNERITALWRRQPVLPFDLALALETDQGRCFLVGTQGAQGHSGLSWSLLDTPNAQPSNIFFDIDPIGPRYISFENACHKSPQASGDASPSQHATTIVSNGTLLLVICSFEGRFHRAAMRLHGSQRVQSDWLVI